MPNLSFKFLGLKEYNARLAKQNKLVKKANKEAIKAAMKPVLAAQKSKAPKYRGLLKKALGKRMKTYRMSERVVGIVGPRSDKVTVLQPPHGPAKRISPSRYAHLAEKGRRALTTTKIFSDGDRVFGKHIAAENPHPFVQPSLAANHSRCISEMGSQYHRVLESQQL